MNRNNIIRERKGQYFLLFGFILLLSSFYFLITTKIPLSSYSPSHKDRISQSIEDSLFYSFYSSLPALHTMINEYISGSEEGVLFVTYTYRINESYYNLSIEVYNKEINYTYFNISMGSEEVVGECYAEYCDNEYLIQLNNREENITIDLKYFMDNELINISSTYVTFLHNTYIYYYALKSGGEVVSDLDII